MSNFTKFIMTLLESGKTSVQEKDFLTLHNGKGGILIIDPVTGAALDCSDPDKVEY